MDIKINVDALPEILEKAIISDPLRFAVTEIVKALMVEDMNLAYQLSSVKSFICGGMDVDQDVHNFCENHKHNENILGRSVYGLLDTLHFEIAMNEGKLGSGTYIVGLNGIVGKPLPTEDHPTLERIRFEHTAIHEASTH